MNKRIPLRILTGLIILAAGCGVTQSHIGKNFDYSWATACTWENLPASCVILTEHFTFNLDVGQLATGEYTIDGYAEVNEPTKSHANVYTASFTFLLGNEGTIHEAVYHSPTAGDLWSGFPLETQFTSQRDVDALFLNYEIVHYSDSDVGRARIYKRSLEPSY